MTYQNIINLIYSLSPSIQWVRPYQDNPVPLTDFGQISFLYEKTLGYSQERRVQTSNDFIEIAFDVLRIYTFQIDFYGENALNNALVFKQTLEVNLTPNLPISLKSFSDTRNLTELLDDKSFMQRYNFELEVFAVNTIFKKERIIRNIEFNLKRI